MVEIPPETLNQTVVMLRDWAIILRKRQSRLAAQKRLFFLCPLAGPVCRPLPSHQKAFEPTQSYQERSQYIRLHRIKASGAIASNIASGRSLYFLLLSSPRDAKHRWMMLKISCLKTMSCENTTAKLWMMILTIKNAKAPLQRFHKNEQTEPLFYSIQRARA